MEKNKQKYSQWHQKCHYNKICNSIYNLEKTPHVYMIVYRQSSITITDQQRLHLNVLAESNYYTISDTNFYIAPDIGYFSTSVAGIVYVWVESGRHKLWEFRATANTFTWSSPCWLAGSKPSRNWYSETVAPCDQGTSRKHMPCASHWWPSHFCTISFLSWRGFR